jgi:hypothetical protein
MHGGDLTLVSGSGSADSGEVLISSSLAASSDATSGNVRLTSRSADALGCKLWRNYDRSSSRN